MGKDKRSKETTSDWQKLCFSEVGQSLPVTIKYTDEDANFVLKYNERDYLYQLTPTSLPVDEVNFLQELGDSVEKVIFVKVSTNADLSTTTEGDEFEILITLIAEEDFSVNPEDL